MSEALTALLAMLDAEGAEPGSRRDKVLDAALEAFMDFGFRRTSMGEVAKRGGVSPATLYRWFEGKDDLVRAVTAREMRKLIASVEEAIDREAPAHEQLAEMAVQLARRLQLQPLLSRVVQTEPEDVLPSLTVHGTPLIEGGILHLSMHINRLVDEGKLEPIDPTLVSEVISRLVHSICLTPSQNFPVEDEEKFRDAALFLFERLLRAPQ